MNKLLKNFFSVLAGRISGHSLMAIASIYLARILRPESYGVIGFLSSYVSFFTLLASLGIPIYGARELAKIDNPSQKSQFTGKWLGTNILLASAIYLLFVGSLWLLPISTIMRQFGIIWGARLFFSGASCHWVFQAHERMGLVGLKDLMKGLIFCGLALIIIKHPEQLLGVAWLNYGASFVGELFLLILLFSGFLGFIPKISFFRRADTVQLKHAIRIGFALLMVQIYYRTDNIILELLKGEKYVGLYSAAYQLIFIGETIAVLYFASILPRISTFWQDNRQKLTNLLDFSMSIFTALGCLLGIIGMLFSSEIINLVYGADYISHHQAFGILACSMTMTYIALTPAYFLLGTQYQKECSHATMAAAAANLILNFPLIIYYGVYGAAIATLFAKITEFIYIYVKTNERIALNWSIGRIFRLALAAAVSVGIGIAVRAYIGILAINIIAVCASYILAALFLRVISIKKLKQSMELIGK